MVRATNNTYRTQQPVTASASWCASRVVFGATMMHQITILCKSEDAPW
jgi:hypothetical protein